MPFLDLKRETQAVRLHYQLDGAPELSAAPGRPVLVLSNSLGTNLSMWSPQLAALTPHFTVLRYDARGHGQSSVPPGPYTIEQMGRDVLALLDALHLDRVHFCGISMGGMVGQWLGIHAPHRLHRLVLSNTAAKIGTAEGWNARIESIRSGGMQSAIPAILDRWFTADFRRDHPQEVDRTRAMLQATALEGYLAACAAVRDADFRADVHAIGVPTLVICGTHDPATPPADSNFIAAQIRRARLLAFPAAHLANIEAAAAYTQALLDFLVGSSIKSADQTDRIDEADRADPSASTKPTEGDAR